MSRITVVLCLLALLVLASCDKASVQMQIFTEDYPPISFADGDTISGYATDIVRAMQKKIGSNEKITLANWNEAYTKALNEPNVILFSMEQTPRRKDLFHWIGPLGENSSSFYVRKDSDLALVTPEEAKALSSIATTTDWFSEQYLKDNGFDNLSSFPKPTDNIKEVMENRAKATIMADLTAKQIIKQAGYAEDDLKPILEVMRTQYYIAISKPTKAKTVAKWEKAFMDLQKDGTVNRIKSEWFR